MAKSLDKYWERIRAFPLRPIRTEADRKRATAMLHTLLDADQLTAAEQDYLVILGDLIEAYEDATDPLEPLLPYELLAAAIRTKGVTQSAVAKATGIPMSTISDLLTEKRDFNVSHIRKLCAYFRLEPSAFVQVPADRAD